MRRTDRASLSVMVRFLKRLVTSFVRRQKNSARSSRTLSLVGLLRASFAPLASAIVPGIMPIIIWLQGSSARRRDVPHRAFPHLGALAFRSKKWANLQAAYALNFAYYNFCRVHRTLRVTPAMETGLTDHIWSIEELLAAYTLVITPSVVYRYAIFLQDAKVPALLSFCLGMGCPYPYRLLAFGHFCTRWRCRSISGHG